MIRLRIIHIMAAYTTSYSLLQLQRNNRFTMTDWCAVAVRLMLIGSYVPLIALRLTAVILLADVS